MGRFDVDPHVVHKDLHTEFHNELDQLVDGFLESNSKKRSNSPDRLEKLKAHLYFHMSWEEEVLYPLLEADTEETELISMMKNQHRLLRKLIEYSEKNLKNRKKKIAKEEGNIDHVEYLDELLKSHAILEELLLFPLIDKNVGKKELNDALAELYRRKEEEGVS